jgi:hypothetical protein
VLQVFDKKEGRSWTSTPQNCGFEKDLYSLRLITGDSTDAFEKDIADTESRLAPTLAKAIAEGSWPSTTMERADLLRFAALMHFRNPRVLAFCNQFANSEIAHKAIESVKSGEFARDYEERYSRPPTPEEERDFVNSIVRGDIRTKMESSGWMELITKGVNEVGPKLALKHWHVLTARPDAPDFICSDAPVVLTLRKPELLPPRSEPGVSTPHTWTLFPLARRIVLIGSCENNHPRGPSDSRQVAFINRLTIDNATRFLYSSTRQIAWAHGRHVLGTDELITWLKTGNPWA